MRRVIVGRLAAKPEVKEVKLKNGNMGKVTDFAIYEADRTSAKTGEDGKAVWPEMIRNCRAWGDVATELSGKEKGEVVAAVATIKVNNYEKDGKVQRREFFQFDKLGNAKELVEQNEKLFSAFVKGEIEKLDAGVDPSFLAVEGAKDEQNEMTMDADMAYENENFMENV